MIAGVVAVRYILLPLLGTALVKGAVRLGLIQPDPLYQFILHLQYAVPPAMNIGNTFFPQEDCNADVMCMHVSEERKKYIFVFRDYNAAVWRRGERVLGDLRLGVRAGLRRRHRLVRLLHVDAVVSSSNQGPGPAEAIASGQQALWLETTAGRQAV